VSGFFEDALPLIVCVGAYWVGVASLRLPGSTEFRPTSDGFDEGALLGGAAGFVDEDLIVGVPVDQAPARIGANRVPVLEI